MGYDLVTWQPLVNQWDIPGSTLLDGTLDLSTPNQTLVQAGDASGFSTVPSIAELNASSHFNQVVGLYNRRAGLYNNAFGTSLAILSYKAVGDKITASDFLTLFADILTLRTTEGFVGPAPTWPAGLTTPATNGKIYGYHLATLRKALYIQGELIFSANNINTNLNWDYQRLDSPTYGTISSQTVTPNIAGKSNQLQLGTIPPLLYQRDRCIYNVKVPDWLTTGAAWATWGLKANTSGSISTGVPPWNILTYSMSTDVHAPVVADFTTAGNNYEGGFSALTNAQQIISVNPVNIYPRAGGYLGFMMVGSREIADIPVTTTTEDEFAAGYAGSSLTVFIP